MILSLTGALVRVSKRDAIDGAPFVVGCVTLLKQFHASCLEQFIGFLGQYVRFSVSATSVRYMFNTCVFHPIHVISTIFINC